MATYAIGDIQGCHSEFLQLLELCGFSKSRDRLWLVGDLINRGPDSLAVLRFVRDLADSAIVVLGNHDLHLLMRSAGYGRANAEDTLDAVLAAPDRQALIDWLRAQPLMHVEADYAMVHAGLLPQWSVAEAQELAAEVSAALRAPDYTAFLANMWGSKPDHWSADLRGWERLRVVVNAMTRLRFCSANGVMDFHAKGPAHSGPDGFMPWFAVPGRRSASHTLVCGHWSALGFMQQPGLIALDSGCLWGGSLTAFRLEDQRVFQLSCPARSTAGA
ncbi:MAG: Bis(5-nucleosyl)-tetraphosphatase, symmetrical [Pseudomonadota bacterium]|jgi:bis(5'-nucleosyl)-tetraphosphatase (symmetrical)